MPTSGAAFATIHHAALTRHGAGALEARLSQPKTADELRATPDDRYLSQMQLRIFRAGLKHSLVDAKLPAFVEVFYGFEPRRVIRDWRKLRYLLISKENLPLVSD